MMSKFKKDYETHLFRKQLLLIYELFDLLKTNKYFFLFFITHTFFIKGFSLRIIEIKILNLRNNIPKSEC